MPRPTYYEYTKKHILLGVFVNIFFAFLEIGGAFLSQSLALAADAMHRIVDALNLFTALVHLTTDEKMFKKKHDRAFLRVATSMLFFQTLGIFFLTFTLIAYALAFLFTPVTTRPTLTLFIGLLGLFLNVFVITRIGYGKRFRRPKTILFQIIEDIFGWAGVIFVGGTVLLTSWHGVDALAALVFSVIILVANARVFRSAIRLFRNGPRPSFTTRAIRHEIQALINTFFVYNLKCWYLGKGKYYTTCEISAPGKPMAVIQKNIKKARKHLADKYNIVFSHLHIR